MSIEAARVRYAAILLANTAIALGAFALGTAVAELAGATNLGTSLGIGQIAFAAALVYVLLRR